jgi:hypothetical protein
VNSLRSLDLLWYKVIRTGHACLVRAGYLPNLVVSIRHGGCSRRRDTAARGVRSTGPAAVRLGRRGAGLQGQPPRRGIAHVGSSAQASRADPRFARCSRPAARLRPGREDPPSHLPQVAGAALDTDMSGADRLPAGRRGVASVDQPRLRVAAVQALPRTTPDRDLPRRAEPRPSLRVDGRQRHLVLRPARTRGRTHSRPGRPTDRLAVAGRRVELRQATQRRLVVVPGVTDTGAWPLGVRPGTPPPTVVGRRAEGR